VNEEEDKSKRRDAEGRGGRREDDNWGKYEKVVRAFSSLTLSFSVISADGLCVSAF
jgi:hypothetical protein